MTEPNATDASAHVRKRAFVDEWPSHASQPSPGQSPAVAILVTVFRIRARLATQKPASWSKSIESIPFVADAGRSTVGLLYTHSVNVGKTNCNKTSNGNGDFEPVGTTSDLHIGS